jgi:chorismate mutase
MKELREKINNIDENLLSLLSERRKLSVRSC